MKKLLKKNSLILALSVLLLGTILYYISHYVVETDVLWEKFQAERFQKENNVNPIDVDLIEFNDELGKFERQPEASDIEDYEWTETDFTYYFYFFLLYLLVVVGVVACLLWLFVRRLRREVSFLQIFNAAVLAFTISYVPYFIKIFYFLVVKQDYTFQDVLKFENIISLRQFFDKESLPQWFSIASFEFKLVYILFPVLLAYLVRVIHKTISFRLLVVCSYLFYFIALIVYGLLCYV